MKIFHDKKVLLALLIMASMVASVQAETDEERVVKGFEIIEKGTV